ncbi:MAG: hypothetical protein AAFV88_03560 [Planctomycetota bacterium]
MIRIAICFALMLLAGQVIDAEASEKLLQQLQAEFSDYSGAEIVFARDDLPPGKYHDVLQPLEVGRRASALKACVAEAKRYPPGFLGDMGLHTVGVFAVCVSKSSGPTNRPFDRQLGGYRYFGVYNGSNAIAIAMYTEGQLALTFHHEVFHHVDSTVDGITESWQLSSDDAFYRAAVAGTRRYSAPPVTPQDLAALKKKRLGMVLKDTVSEYAATNVREDQAETARHFMSLTADSLVQCIEQPELPGSQRILHVIGEYEQAIKGGPGFDWFVDVALERLQSDVFEQSTKDLLQQLQDFHAKEAASSKSSPARVRAILRELTRRNPTDPESLDSLLRLAAKSTKTLMTRRILENGDPKRFVIWGNEGKDGVNTTLQRDLAQLGADAERFAWLYERHSQGDESTRNEVRAMQQESLELLQRYNDFVRRYWNVTRQTQDHFDQAVRTLKQNLVD